MSKKKTLSLLEWQELMKKAKSPTARAQVALEYMQDNPQSDAQKAHDAS